MTSVIKNPRPCGLCEIPITYKMGHCEALNHLCEECFYRNDDNWLIKGRDNKRKTFCFEMARRCSQLTIVMLFLTAKREGKEFSNKELINYLNGEKES